MFLEISITVILMSEWKLTSLVSHHDISIPFSLSFSNFFDLSTVVLMAYAEEPRTIKTSMLAITR